MAELPGISYEGYVGLSKAYGVDPGKAPEPIPCESAIQLASWFKLASYLLRYVREGK